jgi:preprotein translocase subunit SecE
MAKVSPSLFIRQVRQEAGKVTWPSRRETVQMTTMVFIVVFVVSIFLYFTDQLIAFGLRSILGIGG